MFDVVCVVWGDWPKGAREWAPEYVARLRRGIARHCSLPYRFVCITDRPEAVEADLVLPLDTPSRVGVLPKLSAYNPGLPLSDRVFVIDLDTVIVGSMDEIFNYDGDFATREAYLPKEHARFCGIGGDLISFRRGADAPREMWRALSGQTKQVAETSKKGDERQVYKIWLVERHGIRPDFWQRLYPDQYESYKLIIRRRADRLPGENARLVTFHGEPRPHDVVDKVHWVRENWV